ncbi:hypothetical protein LBMAG56_41870 [Verrucomicrobiota bacterium]|nr:hypothetical protein LBMAG56_41870 [Verrucomicrobiota bacterium]
MNLNDLLPITFLARGSNTFHPMTKLTLGNPKQLVETVRIGTYSIKVYCESDDILLQASGFTMLFPERPNSPFRLKRDSRPASALLDDPVSMQQIKELGERWRAEVHARIRSDWGERCFAPDANGRWHHPLFESSGTHFSCIHCGKKFPGAEVAANLWHCPAPKCNGSPIDIRTGPA